SLGRESRTSFSTSRTRRGTRTFTFMPSLSPAAPRRTSRPTRTRAPSSTPRRPKHPDDVVIGMNDRDPKYHDLYRVSLKTGARTLLQKNDGYRGFVLDDDFKVHLGTKINPDGGKTYFARGARNELDVPYLTVAFEDRDSVLMDGF